MNYSFKKDDINLLESYTSLLSPSNSLKIQKSIIRDFMEILINSVYRENNGNTKILRYKKQNITQEFKEKGNKESNNNTRIIITNPDKIHYFTKVEKIFPDNFYNTLNYTLKEGNSYGAHSNDNDPFLAGMDNIIGLKSNALSFLKWYFYNYKNLDPTIFNIPDQILKRIEEKKLNPQHYVDAETIDNANTFRKNANQIFVTRDQESLNTKLEFTIDDKNSNSFPSGIRINRKNLLGYLILLIIFLSFVLFIVSLTRDSKEKERNQSPPQSHTNMLDSITNSKKDTFDQNNRVKNEINNTPIIKHKNRENEEENKPQVIFHGTIKYQTNNFGGTNSQIIADNKDTVND